MIFYITASALIKLSILFFYRRIFVGRKFNVSSWIVISLTLVWFVYGFLAWILYCGSNVHANFEGGWSTCDAWGFDMQPGVFLLDSVIDLCLLLLPIPFVSILPVPLPKVLMKRLTCFACIGFEIASESLTETGNGRYFPHWKFVSDHASIYYC